MEPKATAHEIFKKADIEIQGARPWDLKIHDDRVYDRVLSGGTLAAGESYMDGWWDADDLAEFFNKVWAADLKGHFKPNLEALWYYINARFLNLQTRAKAPEVAEAHYNLGNNLYEKMLGPSMVYTCAYWKGTDNLTQAQYNKLDLICKKIGLKKGDRVLDIGCGFGAFAKFAAERYGASVVGTSVSKEQIAYAEAHTRGLPVEIRFQDYRETNDGPFDHIVSIGMFEAVGFKNFRTFMRSAHSLLKPRGLFLLHTIGSPRSVTAAEAWFNKYIFPNGMLPSVAQVGKSVEDLFIIEDWHNFGADYDKTLLAWWNNFDAAWPTLQAEYGDRFYRMWKYYLLCMAGTFRSRASNQLWQIVLSKGGTPGGYQSVR